MVYISVYHNNIWYYPRMYCVNLVINQWLYTYKSNTIVYYNVLWSTILYCTGVSDVYVIIIDTNVSSI